ncbi:MAG: YicC/YloC family endoribonuclease, partial [Desulfobulbaceae bacterium]|nr:YicC/YloC family endoribonuclease [Desulfobulbaceae bacterium]
MKRPYSMTAFGRGESGGERRWTVELRSVNHRFCDVRVKMPREYAILEDRIKKEVAAVFSRGHIEVVVSLLGGRGQGAQARVNLDLAGQYMACLEELQRSFNLEGKPSLAMLASLPDVITEDEVDENLDEVWGEIREAVVAAVSACLQMRADEGQSLKEELLTRLEGFEVTVNRIGEAIPGLVGRREGQLKER